MKKSFLVLAAVIAGAVMSAPATAAEAFLAMEREGIRLHIPVTKTPDGKYMFATSSAYETGNPPFAQCKSGPWYYIYTGVVEPADLSLKLHVIPTCVKATLDDVVWDIGYAVGMPAPTVSDTTTHYLVTWNVNAYQNGAWVPSGKFFFYVEKNKIQ